MIKIYVVIFVLIGFFACSSVNHSTKKVTNCPTVKLNYELVKVVIDSVIGDLPVKELIIDDSLNEKYKCYFIVNPKRKVILDEAHMNELYDSHCRNNEIRQAVNLDSFQGLKQQLISYKEFKYKYDSMVNYLHPHKAVYFTFSRPGFDKSNNYALVYVFYVFHSLAAEGGFYLLKKDECKWKIVAKDIYEWK